MFSVSLIRGENAYREYLGREDLTLSSHGAAWRKLLKVQIKEREEKKEPKKGARGETRRNALLTRGLTENNRLPLAVRYTPPEDQTDPPSVNGALMHTFHCAACTWITTGCASDATICYDPRELRSRAALVRSLSKSNEVASLTRGILDEEQAAFREPINRMEMFLRELHTFEKTSKSAARMRYRYHVIKGPCCLSNYLDTLLLLYVVSTPITLTRSEGPHQRLAAPKTDPPSNTLVIPSRRRAVMNVSGDSRQRGMPPATNNAALFIGTASNPVSLCAHR
ncbi:hypothetical protein ALC60_08346 [Trachymyrmex zeteki]|uniref:Uncharacterized protein n=1 Tax=Mycetomoellerius zeteki TaxID=64791 RepID=A0A151WXF2_9HYME|nr:hypothetical protein ALC60_08346 [Trachymyrmex zeteki]